MFGRIHLSAALIGASTAVLLGIAPAGAAEIDDLKAKVEALEKKVGEIAATSVSISGYVKADFYLDNRDDLGNTFTFNNPIRLDGEPGDDDEDGAVGMHAQQSRFALSTSTPTSFGALNTVAEIGFDPYDDAPDTPYVRLANGALGPVLAGLAWSIRGDDHTGADTVEYDGPAGVVAVIEPQLRLTLPLGEGFYGQMAVEPPISGNEVPTFLAALRYSSGWGAVNVTGAVGRYDDDNGQNVTTHSFHVGAHLNATDATRVMATLNMTSGDGQIYGGSGAISGDAPGGNLKAEDSIGGMAGISHGWSDSMRSGVYFGWVENDNPGGDEQDVANAARQRHLEPGVAGRYRLRGHPRYARDSGGGRGRGHARPDRRQVQLLAARAAQFRPPPHPRGGGRRSLTPWATPQSSSIGTTSALRGSIRKSRAGLRIAIVAIASSETPFSCSTWAKLRNMSGSFGLKGWPESVAMIALSGPTASTASFIWSEVTDWNIGMQLTAQYSIRQPARASSTWVSDREVGALHLGMGDDDPSVAAAERVIDDGADLGLAQGGRSRAPRRDRRRCRSPPSPPPSAYPRRARYRCRRCRIWIRWRSSPRRSPRTRPARRTPGHGSRRRWSASRPPWRPARAPARPRPG